MNRKQRVAVIAALACIAIMAIFPPWVDITHYQSLHTESSVGYSFIGSPPQSKMNPIGGVRIDLTRFLVGILAVGAAAGIMLLFLRDAKKG